MVEPTTTDLLLVFAKAPRPGAAKTRLIPAIGEEAAAELYRRLAEEVVRQTEPRPGDYRRLGFFAPADARSEMEAWFPREEWLAQEGGDLGARMTAAFDLAFRRGARRVAIVGTDAPAVTRGTVLEALAGLQDHDLVLGPAADGGYYLMALRRPCPELFRGVAWSTPAVLASTVERAEALGLAVRLLAPLRDIDTLDDIRAEWGSLRLLLDPSLRERLGRLLGFAISD